MRSRRRKRVGRRDQPIGGNPLKCKALVKVSKDAFRPCKKPGEFHKWVYVMPASFSWRSLQIVCFTHSRAKEVFFEK